MNTNRSKKSQKKRGRSNGHLANGNKLNGTSIHSEKRAPFPSVVLYRSILNDLPLIMISLLVISIALGIGLFLRESDTRLFGLEPKFVFTISLTIVSSILIVAILFRRFNVRYLIAEDGVKALREFYRTSKLTLNWNTIKSEVRRFIVACLSA